MFNDSRDATWFPVPSSANSLVGKVDVSPPEVDCKISLESFQKQLEARVKTLSATLTVKAVGLDDLMKRYQSRLLLRKRNLDTILMQRENFRILSATNKVGTAALANQMTGMVARGLEMTQGTEDACFDSLSDPSVPQKPDADNVMDLTADSEDPPAEDPLSSPVGEDSVSLPTEESTASEAGEVDSGDAATGQAGMAVYKPLGAPRSFPSAGWLQDWEAGEHIFKKVRREVPGIGLVDGWVVAHLPADANQGVALWHVLYDALLQGEDLTEEEVTLLRQSHDDAGTTDYDMNAPASAAMPSFLPSKKQRVANVDGDDFAPVVDAQGQ